MPVNVRTHVNCGTAAHIAAATSPHARWSVRNRMHAIARMHLLPTALFLTSHPGSAGTRCRGCTGFRVGSHPAQRRENQFLLTPQLRVC
eukprot:6184313-Pleurochrysis_carterae.AAC.1